MNLQEAWNVQAHYLQFNTFGDRTGKLIGTGTGAVSEDEADHTQVNTRMVFDAEGNLEKYEVTVPHGVEPTGDAPRKESHGTPIEYKRPCGAKIDYDYSQTPVVSGAPRAPWKKEA